MTWPEEDMDWKTLAVLALTLGWVPLAATAAQAQARPSPWSVSAVAGLPEDVTLSGSFRVRQEHLEGQPRPGFNGSDSLTSIRTTLLAEYRPGPWRFGVEIFDSRAYGADSGTPISTNEVNTFEPVQAYVGVDLKDLLGPGSRTTLQAGRFVVNLGSRRLVAADDFRNTTNGYTGVRTDITLAEGLKATALYVQPQTRRPDDLDSILDLEGAPDRESDDLALWGAVVSQGRLLDGAVGGAMGEISYIHFEEQDSPGRPTRDRSLDTVSLRLIREPAAKAWDFEVETIGQVGSLRTGLAATAPPADVLAYFVHLDSGYSFDAAWKPRLSVEFDYASGDRPGGRFGRFDTLFGMRRADLAPSGLYNSVGRANVLTPAVRLELAPSSRLDGFVAYRGLWLASRTDSFSTTSVRDATGGSGNFAGQQVEGRVRYWLVPDALRLEANGLALFKGRFLNTAPNAPRSGDTLFLTFSLIAYF
jgi:hypothetical protein